MRNVSL